MHLKNNSVLTLFILLAGLCAAQPKVSLTGPEQARPGAGTGLVLKIERNGVQGIVRFIQEMPAGWEIIPSFEPFPGVSVEDGFHKAVWLSFPLADTVVYSYLLRIPPTENKTVILKGRLEYFENGKLVSFNVPAFEVKLRRHFSRFL